MTFTPVSQLERQQQIPSFDQRLRQEGAQLKRNRVEIVQVNLGKLCNQTCTHCHVEAGPSRRETMDQATAERVIDFARVAGAKTADLTGGAPEMNPAFRFLAGEFRRAGLHVIVRSNLTVLMESGQLSLPDFLAEQQVEIIASLPCYTQENVDGQRGRGVYEKSIAAFRRLNELGYGRPGSGLLLNLVYNPGGAFLPGPQAGLEADYKRELIERFGLVFNHLYTITNASIGRFAHTLDESGQAAGYSRLLSAAFNPATLRNLMCLRQVSLAWDGYLYDCDFNQMLGLRLGDRSPFRLGNQPPDEIVRGIRDRSIITGSHCYACTAGLGSSCGGALV